MLYCDFVLWPRHRSAISHRYIHIPCYYIPTLSRLTAIYACPLIYLVVYLVVFLVVYRFFSVAFLFTFFLISDFVFVPSFHFCFLTVIWLLSNCYLIVIWLFPLRFLLLFLLFVCCCFTAPNVPHYPGSKSKGSMQIGHVFTIGKPPAQYIHILAIHIHSHTTHTYPSQITSNPLGTYLLTHLMTLFMHCLQSQWSIWSRARTSACISNYVHCISTYIKYISTYMLTHLLTYLLPYTGCRANDQLRQEQGPMLAWQLDRCHRRRVRHTLPFNSPQHILLSTQ